MTNAAIAERLRPGRARYAGIRSFCCRLALLVPGIAVHPAFAEGSAVHLSANDLFRLADIEALRNAGKAFAIYRALERDPNIDIRCEARFRHGRLLAKQKRYADAAVLFRAILDEKPTAQPVRLELAQMLALMGREGEARRTLREARAGGLPPDIARIVDQFSLALRSTKPFGASIEFGLAPTTNVNRATGATTLDTVIAPLILSRDARARSGVGINLGGQTYAKLPISDGTRLTAQLSSQNAFYRDSQFNDSTIDGAVGAETVKGRSRYRLTAGPSRRLYGGSGYMSAINGSFDWQRALGARAQLELTADASSTRYDQNALQNGWLLNTSLSYEKSFSPRFGGRVSLSGQRQTAADPGFATSSANTSLLVWREAGKATLYGSLGLSHLEADERLFLFPRRRIEWLYRASAGVALRKIQVAGFSPVMRLNVERNQSTVGIYDYRRVSAEFAVNRAF